MSSAALLIVGCSSAKHAATGTVTTTTVEATPSTLSPLRNEPAPTTSSLTVPTQANCQCCNTTADANAKGAAALENVKLLLTLGLTLTTEVPPSIPKRGVVVNGLMLLMPAQATDHPAISANQALTIVRGYANPTSGPFSAPVLTRFTDGGAPLAEQLAALREAAMPPRTGASLDVTQRVNRLAWVITQTYPQPVNVSQAPHVVLCVTHAESVIDAVGGQFLVGGFTP